jgi:hypothetical protein
MTSHHAAVEVLARLQLARILPVYQRALPKATLPHGPFEDLMRSRQDPDVYGNRFSPAWQLVGWASLSNRGGSIQGGLRHQLHWKLLKTGFARGAKPIRLYQ